MAKMKVEIISSETIKPSLPTPSHLRTYSLSIMDQLLPPFYIPMTIFYPKPSTNFLPSSDHATFTTNISIQLKASLSETLTRFYPLAGRVKDHLSVECNDEGVLFTLAQVDYDLSGFLKEPKFENFHLLLPNIDRHNFVPSRAVQIAVQVNVFACGGIAIGTWGLHKIIDGATVGAFLKCWAATNSATSAAATADRPIAKYPNYDDFTVASRLFPPKESLPDYGKTSSSPRFVVQLQKPVWKRYVFDANAISTLKSKLMTTTHKPPSKFAVISSLILKHVMAAVATTSKSDQSAIKKPSALTFAVDMRPRMIPPVSQYSVGNMVWHPVSLIHDTKPDLQQLHHLVTETIAKTSGDFLTTLQDDLGGNELCRLNKEIDDLFTGSAGVSNTYLFTSWCKLGFSELDFGWGKPIWITNDGRAPPKSFMNQFILGDTISGDGIEAFLLLDEAVATILGCDQDFLTFATVNPSIL